MNEVSVPSTEANHVANDDVFTIWLQPENTGWFPEAALFLLGDNVYGPSPYP